MIDIYKILVLDIETVSQYKTYTELDEKTKNFWDKKCNFILKKEDETPENTYSRAAIYAEYGKIVCISCGYFVKENNETILRTKSFYNTDEKILLQEFSELLKHKIFNSANSYLAGHNVKEFDIPYIARRMIIHQLELPNQLKIAGKKPWEINFLDTLDLWKFGDYKHYTSLDLLAHIFNVTSSKDDIDGGMVHDVYYNENNLERIKIYCEKDVDTTSKVLLRLLEINK